MGPIFGGVFRLHFDWNFGKSSYNTDLLGDFIWFWFFYMPTTELVTLIFCYLFRKLFWPIYCQKKKFWWWKNSNSKRRSNFEWHFLLWNNLFLSKNTSLTLKHEEDMKYFYECDTTILLSKVNIKKFELRLENVAKTSCWKNRQYRFIIQNICEICDLQISGQIKYYVLQCAGTVSCNKFSFESR